MLYLLGISVLLLGVAPWLIIRELNKHHHRLLVRADARVDTLEDKLIFMSGRPVPRFGGIGSVDPEMGRHSEYTEEELARIAEGWKEF